jgi:hypothetical protein
LGLVCIRFVYVLTVRIVAALRLCRRDEDHKTIEILLLRHQLSVLQRQLAATKRPRPDWADLATIALLISLVPKARRAGFRLFVAPDRILRWHRDLLRCQRPRTVLVGRTSEGEVGGHRKSRCVPTEVSVGGRGAPVGGQFSGTTPLPASAWASRCESPLVRTRCAWWSRRSTAAVAMVFGMIESKPLGWMFEVTAIERRS